MAEQMWLAIVWSISLGLLLSFLPELLLKPRPAPPWQRRCRGLILHAGIWLLLYSPLLILFRRPLFASASLLALLLFVILISNAKYHSLREPFIYQDFSYFLDALRYPRLYLPFLGFWSALLSILVLTITVSTGLFLEQGITIPTAFAGSIVCALTGAGLIMTGASGSVRLLLDPCEDLVALGLLPVLWHYGMAERHPWQGSGREDFAPLQHHLEGVLPNLVVIQSESFFDPRRWIKGIAPELLTQFDALSQTAASHGQLEVPAWGANTVRTEFAFLSGIANDRLGIHRFKPYRRIARQGVPTLPGFLKSLGYRTVCLHPYSAQFYGRDEVFPLLGFDEFIDISRFDKSDYAGQYVGDAAVAREVCRELALHDISAAKPVFIFVITMENHGPLHLEQVQAGEMERFYTLPPLAGCDDLIVYLRHLEQADKLMGTVCKQMESMERSGWFSVYGDHLPIMPEIYRQLGEPDGTVDYLIWSSKIKGDSEPSSRLRVEQLPGLILKTVFTTKISKQYEWNTEKAD